VNLKSIEGMLKTLIAHPDCVSDLFKTKVKNWIASQYWGSKLWSISDDDIPEYYKEANLKTPGNNILKAKRDSLYNELSRDIQTQRARVRQSGPPPPDPMQATRKEYYNQFSRKGGGKRKTKKLRKRKTLLKKTNSSRF
jgi:hypothetical protein